MSFQFNLSALTESARDRLTRLETQGSALRERLLSPASRVSAGHMAVSQGTAFPSPPPRGSSGGLLTSMDVGVSGESLSVSAVSGGGAAAVLPVFEMTADLHCRLCLGTVGNGLKFCTLGGDQCSFTSHSKKVPTEVGALYIASVRNSAFARHCIQANLLSPPQLSSVLAEKHTKEEWVYLFHTWKIQVGSPSAVPCDPAIRGLISAMKPAAK